MDLATQLRTLGDEAGWEALQNFLKAKVRLNFEVARKRTCSLGPDEALAMGFTDLHKEIVDNFDSYCARLANQGVELQRHSMYLDAGPSSSDRLVFKW